MLPSAANSLARFAAALLFALVALEVLLPTGCIGLQAIVGGKRTTPTRALGTTAGMPGEPAGTDSIRTRADALRIWGTPRRQRLLADGREVWKYREREMRWRGGLVWAVLVPAPLLVPTGRRKVWLEFAGDSLTRVTNQYTDDKCYGLFLFQPTGGKSMSQLFQVH